MKEIKMEWCENWIRSLFEKRLQVSKYPNVGIEINAFWEKAEKAGLWEEGIYNGPMTKAVQKLCTIDTITNDENKFLFAVFRMKK